MAARGIASSAFFLLARAYDPYEVFEGDMNRDGCSSIIVGSGATVDGSAMTSHANDCTDCDWRMAHVPARDWPEGSMRPVYDGRWQQYPRLIDPERSSILTPGAGVEKSTIAGYVPQAPHTYALWESSYSLINEKGLALGESTCSAHLIGKSTMDGGDAIFAIRQLMAIALERCATARCAAQTMGDLGAKHGFYGEDPGKGGAGESVQIVDSLGEAWVFHISGGVPATASSSGWLDQRGAMWAAQRVPAGNIAMVANNFIIREIDPQDSENFLYHPGFFELAKEAGLWDGTGPFDFLKIMTPDVRFFRYMAEYPPMPRYVTIRQWWVWRSVAASQGLNMTDNPHDYPFSVPVDRKLTHLDVMDLFRSHYEGTEFDMTLGVMAGPFQSPNRIEGGVGFSVFPGQLTRGTSIGRTSYTQVSVSGGSLESAVWFGPDCSASSVFVPFYASTLGSEGGGRYDVEGWGTGSMKEFSFSSGARQPAWWAFDMVANLMDRSYKNMSQEYVYPKVHSLQREVARQAAEAEAKAKASGGAAVLAEFQAKLQQEVADEWWKFAGMLVVRYNDNMFAFGERAPQKIAPIGYPPFWLEMMGFDNEAYYPSWVTRSDIIPSTLPDEQKQLARFSQQKHAAQDAEGLNLPPPMSAAGVPVPVGWSTPAAVSLAVAAAAALFAAGVVTGQKMGRRSAAREGLQDNYVRIGC